MGRAGTSRETTIDRLDHAGTILQEIMAAPDNSIPEETRTRQMRGRRAEFAQRRICIWRRKWPGRGYLPDGEGMERAGFLCHHGLQPAIFAVLVILWLPGFSFHIADGLIRILLVAAIIILIINL